MGVPYVSCLWQEDKWREEKGDGTAREKCNKSTVRELQLEENKGGMMKTKIYMLNLPAIIGLFYPTN